ncbi:hypothetical protein Tco_0787001 [Tanacetum coccineum]
MFIRIFMIRTAEGVVTSENILNSGDLDSSRLSVLRSFLDEQNSRGHPSSVDVIMQGLEEFKNVSGLVLSIPKSTAFFCNVPNALKTTIINSMPFAEGSLPVRVHLVPSELKKGRAKVAWDSVCKPKLEGGLGIQRLDDFNIALKRK